jgi:hypothetical protein
MNHPFHQSSDLRGEFAARMEAEFIRGNGIALGEGSVEILAEFRQSAIPDALTLANVEWVEGDAAVEILAEHAIAQAQRITSYVTAPAKRILERYEFSRDGGWVAYGTNLEGGRGEVAYFKPKRPRLDFEKRKPIKYETPQGCEATPLIPWVSWEKGFKIAIQSNLEEKYVERFWEYLKQQEALDPPTQTGSLREFSEACERGQYREASAVLRGLWNFSELSQTQPARVDRGGIERFETLNDVGFWTWWRSVNGAIALVEGWKKALSLVAHGVPAIAIRGITQWHKKGTNQLHDVIAQFATASRTVQVIFDEDEKPKTRSDVQLQRMKLAASLERAGCTVLLPMWDGKELGKGIDDVLFGLEDDAQAWLDALLQEAPTLKQVRRGDRTNQALKITQQLNQLSFPVERATVGDYLPALPELQPGAIHVLSASMNAGKTTRIGQDWVQWAIAQGWNVLVLSPLNSLGEQTAQTWRLPHIHHYGTSGEQQGLLWADVSHSHGLVLCPDSLHRVPQWLFDRPVLLILDEANQVISHTTQGDTTKSRYSQILECLSAAARHAIQTGAIVLSEDGLPDRAVNFIKSISGGEVVRAFTHQKQGEPWDCNVYQGQVSGFRGQFLQATADQKLLFVSTSQQETRRVERALLKQRPDLKVVRIDSETNQGGKFSEFFRSPDTWLKTEQPDILILSPSAKSGVSIEGGVSVEDAYFDQVWGYFPALATDSHMQLLGRYRPSVPRVMFCPPFILSSADEALLYPRAIARQLKRNSKLLAGVFGLEELLQAQGDRAEQMATVETAVLDYLSAEIAVMGAQKLMSHTALVSRLEASGHRVNSEICSKDPVIVELWKQITEELWHEDATAFAAATVSDKQTPEWAHKTLESQDSSLEARILAQKVLLREEFPGVLFDNVQECYQALFKDYGAMRRGVTLQSKAENLDAAKAIDQATTEAILSQNIRALRRLPKSAVRAALIAKTGILALLDGTRYHNQDGRVEAIKVAALKFRNEISYSLRLQINETQTGVEIANKLLKKLGLRAVAVARPRKRTEKGDRHYQVVGWDDPVRVRLLEAMRRKLSESTSTICNQENMDLEIADTPSQNSQNIENWGTNEALADVKMWLESAAECPEIRELLKSVPDCVKEQALTA